MNIHRRSFLRASLLAATLVLSSIVFLGCDRKKPAPTPEARATAGPVDATPLPRGPGLASLPLFPETDAPLSVVRTQPEDGSADVDVSADRARIVVQFNHPVVPLVGIEDRPSQPAPLTVSPEVPGTGEWLNTSTYLFTPASDLLAGTDYTVRVTDRLTDILGATLPAEHRFSFTTAAPYVVGRYPEGGSVDVGPGTAISVTFSQAMDRASTAAAFRVRAVGGGNAEADDEPLAGQVTWIEDRTIVLAPSRRLAYDTGYVAELAAGALDATGRVPTRERVTWRFTSAKAPAVTGTKPRDGDTNSTVLRDQPLEIKFASPMNGEKLQVSVQPTITNQSMWLDYDGRTAYVHGGWLASEHYTVRIDGRSPSADGEPLGTDTVIAFSVAPMLAQTWIETPSSRSFLNAYVPQRVYVGAINTPAVALTLARVNAADALRVLHDHRDPKTWPGEPIRAWKVDNAGRLNAVEYVSTTLSATRDGLLAPGVYVVGVGKARELVLVSKVNLTLKTTDREALVWATDLQSGQPVPNLPLRLYDPRNTLLAEGQTDADGVYRGAFAPRKSDQLWESLLAVSVVDGQVVAAAGTDWSNGIQPYEFNLPYDRGRQAFYGTLYTDRPIYRPGQAVYFRGVVRADDDGAYGLPGAGHVVRVLAQDGDGTTVFETDLPVGTYGTFHGEVPLSASAPLGFYNLNARLLRPREGPTPTPRARPLSAPAAREEAAKDAQRRTVWDGWSSFQVAAYRKPEFEVTVEMARPAYLEGETVAVGAASTYYFGGPVADAKAHWRLLSDDYFFPQPEGVSGWWDWIDYDLTESRYWNPEGGVVADGEATLDAEGRAVVEVPADLGDKPLGQVFTFDVEVTDISGQAVAQRAGAVVHKADLYLGLRPRAYLGQGGQPAAVEVLSVDSAGITVTGKAVDLAYFKRDWFSVKEKREDGRFYWTSSYTDTLLSRQTVTTNRRGAAEGRFTPAGPGVFRVVAKAIDADGRTAQSATYVWAYGRGFTNWRQENNDRLQLVADKKAYEPGDTARILVPAPFAGAQALVTTERGGIRSVRRLTLEGNSETIEVPLGEADAPNLYVSVILVKGTGPDAPLPQLKLGYASLNVSSQNKELDITVQPDRTTPYQPGDTVHYAVRATDRQGQPVRTELSVALVDKAILALRPETGPGLMDVFYGQRMLGVATAASFTRSTDRLNAQLAADKKGGGGGLSEPGTVRRVFRDTAYWNAAVVTDERGQAQVAVKLPDNLTTWSLTAHGVTGADTRVGTGRVEIVSTKDLLLRPALPRFAVVGDLLQLSAAVNNATDRAVAAEVSLAVEGLAPQSAMTRRLELPAGGKAAAVFDVTVPATGLRPPTVPDAYGEALVKLHVSGDSREDAVELPIPIYRFSAPTTVGTSGVTEGKVQEAIRLPAGVTPDQGEVTVTLSPSLAAASTRSLQWLEAFAYDCSEQTVSKFLPNVATYQALADLGLERPELRVNLQRAVGMHVQRLQAIQHGEGGWGWWSASHSPSPWISAYAVLGLGMARDAGFSVDAAVLDRGRSFLRSTLAGPLGPGVSERVNERAMVLFALAATGDVPASLAVSLYEERGRMDTTGQAFLALALAKAVGEEDPRVKGLVSNLQNSAVESATGRHWEDRDDVGGRGYGSTSTRATAIALFALARLRPDDPGQPNVVRWLLAARQEDRWASTQETAWAVLAFTAVMRATGELEGRYRWDVRLNDARLGTGTVGEDNVDEAVRLVADIAGMRTDADNRLVLQKSGSGRLYYTAHARYFRPAAGAPPVDAGILLGREYLQVDPRTLRSTGSPIADVHVGEYVQVRLTMILPNAVDYVMLEDPLPAGFEAVDTSLRTASAAASGPELREVQPEGEGWRDGGGSYAEAWWGHHWWSYWVDSQLRDEKAAVFADWLGPGTYQYTYLIRAGVAGAFNVIPATAQAMYFPEVFGRSAGGVIEVALAPQEK